jgi:hypothetical protein
MTFLVFIKHVVIPYDCNRFVSHVKNLITIISQMDFFIAMTINMWYIKILTKNHFQMEDNKKYEMGHLKIPFQTFVG